MCVMHIRAMSEEIDLVSVRSALGMTRAALADEAGVDVSTISRWETKGIPKRGSARALINRLAAQAAQVAEAAA